MVLTLGTFRFQLHFQYGKMIPLFLALFFWTSILAYSVFIDVFIIPSSLRQEIRDPVFPWNGGLQKANETDTSLKTGHTFIDMMLVRRGNPAFNPGGMS